MAFWDREPFPGIVDEESFSFTETGPLRSPIRSFKLRRTEKFQLSLETLCGKEAIANQLLRDGNPYDEGNQRAEIKSILGTTVRLTGVIPESWRTHEDYQHDASELHETAIVSGVEAEITRDEEAVFTFDWLENLSRYYLWPHVVVNDGDKTDKRTYGRTPDAFVLMDTAGEHSSGSAALKLTIGGIDLYLTVNRRKEGTEQINPGYILYRGTPDDQTRRKIRTVLSFALGMYLVHLGYSTYTAQWQLASFRAIRGYSMDMRAFDLHVLPPAWLGAKSHNMLDTAKVARLVSGLYAHYDELDFGNLAWGYWHAMCAPIHIRAVHFGAIIEALQRNYMKARASEFPEKIVAETTKWNDFAKDVTATIAQQRLPEGQTVLLQANVGRLNQVPRATITDQLLKRLEIVLGDDEKQAWRRRHDAAHGNPMAPGREREVIRDSYLLQVMFNRMILRIVDGNGQYYDYSARPSRDFFPIRNLRDPAQPNSGVT
jgi:hypothetical protein